MKEVQDKIKKFCSDNGLDSPVEHRILDLVSEVGELSKDVLKMSNYGREEFKLNSEVELELGDVLYSLITVANSLNVSLEEALEKVVDKYEKRLKKGSAGSEVE
jgi:NTP pyrophosphatase (non-canonical NTP hydrolase)